MAPPTLKEVLSRKAVLPYGHRATRMPSRYKREPLGDLGRDPLAQAVVLPWVPSVCPKCGSACLRDRGLEIGCPCCGWEQVVRRDVNPVRTGGAP